jgi:hypothetical protein
MIGIPSTFAFVKVVPVLLVENVPDDEIELLSDWTRSAVTRPPNRLRSFTVDMAVEDVAPLVVLAADETEVSITPVDARGGSETVVTLLELDIPVFSVQRTVAAVVPALMLVVPAATTTLVP